MFASTTNTSDQYSFLECPPIRPLVMERTTTTTKWRYNNEIAPNCPRCASSNTKFCYYNNYSLSQPRYFCKGCRRYWTKGGSLRNVPVGGGCRKSRRARATRQGGSAHYAGHNLSPVSTGSANESESGTDIDMAAVFAKYVNQNTENNEDSSSLSPGASFTSSENVQTSSLDIDSQLDHNIAMFEYQDQPLDLINGGEYDHHYQIQQVFPDHHRQLSSMHEDINGQDLLYQDCNNIAFEPQGTTTILGDHNDELLWSSDGSNLPDFGSQQAMVQLQDFGLFSADDHDHLRIPTNLVSDNWGSFDLSAYEIFSRP